MTPYNTDKSHGDRLFFIYFLLESNVNEAKINVKGIKQSSR